MVIFNLQDELNQSGMVTFNLQDELNQSGMVTFNLQDQLNPSGMVTSNLHELNQSGMVTFNSGSLKVYFFWFIGSVLFFTIIFAIIDVFLCFLQCILLLLKYRLKINSLMHT